MSLAKYLLKTGEEISPAAMAFLKKNKHLLGAGAAGAAGTGAALAVKPAIDNYAANKAFDHVVNEGAGAASDTLDFAQEHPYIVGGALGLAGAMGDRGGAGDIAHTLTNNLSLEYPQEPKKRRR